MTYHREPAAPTVRETLIAALQDEGYDVLSACQHADSAIADLRVGTNEIAVGDRVFTIQKVQ